MASLFSYSLFHHTSSRFWSLLRTPGPHLHQQVLLVPNPHARTQLFQYLISIQVPAFPIITTIDGLLGLSQPGLSCPESGMTRLLLDTFLHSYQDPVLEPILLTDGFRDQFLNVYTRFHQHPFAATRYRSAADHEHQELSDSIAALFTAFQAFLLQFPPQDWAQLYHRHRSQILSQLSDFMSGKALLMAMFWDLNLLEKEIIHTAISAANSAAWLSPLAPGTASDPVHTRLSDWRGQQQPNNREIEPVGDARPFDADLQLRVCEGPDHEAQWLCQQLLKQAGPFHDYGILIPGSGPARDVIIQALQDAKIPIQFHHNTRLDDCPITHFCLAFLQLLESPFDTPNITQFLANPLAQSIQINDTVSHVNLDQLSSIANEHRLHQGTEYWRQGFSHYLAQLSEYTQDEDEAQGPLALCRQQVAIIHTLADLYEQAHQCPNAQDMTQLIESVMETFDLLNKLRHCSAHVASSPFLAYTHLKEALHRFLAYSQSFPFELKQWCRQLRLFFKDQRLSHTGTHASGVHILTLDSPCLVPLHTLYIPNLLAGQLPQIPTEAFFVSKTQVQALTWDRPDDAIDRQWSQFLAHLYSPARHIYLSYGPQQDRPSLPSHFIQRLQNERGLSLSSSPADVVTETPEPATLAPLHLLPLSISDRLHWAQTHSILDPSKNQEYFHMTFSQSHLSTTQLDTYQTCPHHFYYRYILKCHSAEEVSQDVAAREWGTLVHRLFESFVNQAKSQGIGRITPHNQDAAKALLREIAQGLLHQKQGFFWSVKRDVLLGLKDKEGLIDAIISAELDQAYLLDFLDTERPFKLPISLSDLNTHITITGKIDCLLKAPDEWGLVVLDYKTGRQVPTAADMTHFRHLQLPIYLLATQTLYPQQSIIGGIFFQVHRPGLTEKKVVCCHPSAKSNVFNLGRKRPMSLDADYLPALKRHLQGQLTRLIQGHMDWSLPDVDPSQVKLMKRKRAQQCQVCSYRSICRYPGRFDGEFM